MSIAAIQEESDRCRLSVVSVTVRFQKFDLIFLLHYVNIFTRSRTISLWASRHLFPCQDSDGIQCTYIPHRDTEQNLTRDPRKKRFFKSDEAPSPSTPTNERLRRTTASINAKRSSGFTGTRLFKSESLIHRDYPYHSLCKNRYKRYVSSPTLQAHATNRCTIIAAITYHLIPGFINGTKQYCIFSCMHPMLTLANLLYNKIRPTTGSHVHRIRHNNVCLTHLIQCQKLQPDKIPIKLIGRMLSLPRDDLSYG